MLVPSNQISPLFGVVGAVPEATFKDARAVVEAGANIVPEVNLWATMEEFPYCMVLDAATVAPYPIAVVLDSELTLQSAVAPR
jgi:hypothetical protein